MKFAFPILLSLILLSGCSDSNSEIAQQQSSQASIPPPSQTLPAIKISNIAGKTSNEVDKYLGAPTSTETVNPSHTPCPCEKNFYKNGEIEVVFMEGKADWITVNLPASEIDISGSYSSLQQFEDPTYTYVKVTTN